MRIAIASMTRRKVGGIESYLDAVIAALAELGHRLAFIHEEEGLTSRDRISLPADAPSWCIGDLGVEEAIRQVSGWRPDLIFAHGVASPTVEAELLRVAPGVLFAHAYHGTCISGAKSRLSPRRTPCARRLAWPCLVHYLPRRCGGLSPVTMVHQFRIERARRDLLASYEAVVTASAHMREEYLRHGLDRARVHAIDLPITPPGADERERAGGGAPAESAVMGSPTEWRRLLFIGRLYRLKGVHLLLDAIPSVLDALGGRMRVTIAGDGPERERLTRQAGSVQDRRPDAEVVFTGWVSDTDRGRRIRESDLLVVPSIWPEPFGLVGPESGALGLPAAAFAVGGIPSWLSDGVNGHLAPGSPPTADGLSAAIIASLRDRGHHAVLRRGAREVARRFTMARHIATLLPILEEAASAGSRHTSAVS